MNAAEVLDMLAALTPDLRAAMASTVARSLRVLRVPQPLRLSQWAEKHFYLSNESSYIEGRWVCWPFQRAMLDVMGHDEVRSVTVRKSARVGYTKMLLAYLAYLAEHKRRNGVIYQPTDDDRDEFVTTELEPMLRDVRVMRRVMPRFSRRSKDNTLRTKKFTTGLLHMRGGKAAKNFRRLTVDSVVYDEFSAFDRDIEKEGSPGKLGDKRLEGAVYPKSIAGSTPKLKHNDNTEDRETEADVHMRWHVPCIHCNELHEITFGGKDKTHGLKWLPGQPETVAHICPHCGSAMSQADYLQVWHAGVWICARTGVWIDHRGDFRTAASLDWAAWSLAYDPTTVASPPKHVAMHVWTACAPQATWLAIAEEFIAAARLAERGDLSLLKTFVNTTLGETWEEKGDASDEHALQKRADDYRLGTVPIGALQLTSGIDVQGNRWEIDVWGWGRGLESWLIDTHVIEGNPADEREWEQVALYLQRRYTQAWHGGTLGIDATSIDSGHHTQAVYNFVRLWKSRLRIHAIKGSSEEGKPIKGTATSQDVDWRGQRFPNGIKLWSIGVDTAKDLLHGQLAIVEPGPGFVHFSSDLKREWFEQITAEQRILTKVAGGEKLRWVKRRTRNEKLDCRNYAMHSAHMLGLHKKTDADWLRLEAAVQPPRDLFSAPVIEPTTIILPPEAKVPSAPSPIKPTTGRIGLGGFARFAGAR